MKPSYEEYLKSSARWMRTHKGINYELSHFGVSEYKPEGSWCWYIHLYENMFINPEDFARFDREPELRELSPGSVWETYPYSDVPDYGFHGGITFYDRDTFVAKDGQRYKHIKMGCDYNHLWDEESGYWQGLTAIERDAQKYIDGLVEAVAFKIRCGYSGKIDIPENFYEAENGAQVHKTQEEKLRADGYEKWLPKKREAA